MTAQRPGVDVLHRDVELLGKEPAEARRVENAGHADDLVLGEAGEFLQRPDHRVERIGDADDEGVRGMRLDAFADRFHHLQVDADQVVAAHAGLAGNARGDDADIRILDGGIVVRAGDGDVLAEDRRGLVDIQRLALGNALGDIEQDDVAQFLARRNMGPACRRSCRRRSGRFSRRDMGLSGKWAL